MKINSNDYRVKPDKKVKLDEWPTLGKPVCKSKKKYHKLLEDHVEQLSALQRLHYASNKYALLIIFQGMDAGGKGRRHPARHVRSQSARLPGFQFQTAERQRTGTRFSLANHVRAS